MSLITPPLSSLESLAHFDYLGPNDETQMQFRLLTLQAGESQKFYFAVEETALLLLEGAGQGYWEDDGEFQQKSVAFSRHHWKEECPTVFHFSAGKKFVLKSETKSRWAIIQTKNLQFFTSQCYLPQQVQVEHRGKDILEGTCYRHVRTVFDATIAPAAAKLVVGEVINFPGRWSSYPPHHHQQPEIYYYEFDPVVGGYGHGELGEEVFKIRHQNLLKITGNKDHSQVAAPGFTMYYLWAVCHLEGNPYRGFEYTRPYDQLMQ